MTTIHIIVKVVLKHALLYMDDENAKSYTSYGREFGNIYEKNQCIHILDEQFQFLGISPADTLEHVMDRHKCQIIH